MKNLLFFLAPIAVTFAVFASPESPYAGQDLREIKALSEEEIDGYLNGKGLGYAKAAELNQYPGPRHVLDMADELDLTLQQRTQTQALFDTMHTEAIKLGAQLVDRERELDQQFSDEVITPASLRVLLDEIGILKAKIRYVHLNAHLEQKALLSKHQIQQYFHLRGYGKSHGNGHSHATDMPSSTGE